MRPATGRLLVESVAKTTSPRLAREHIPCPCWGNAASGTGSGWSSRWPRTDPLFPHSGELTDRHVFSRRLISVRHFVADHPSRRRSDTKFMSYVTVFTRYVQTYPQSPHRQHEFEAEKSLLLPTGSRANSAFCWLCEAARKCEKNKNSPCRRC